MELNDLDLYDDELMEFDPSSIKENDNPTIGDEGYQQPSFEFEEEFEEEEEDLVTSLLKSKGIDPSAIKMQNEEGVVEEISFDNLSRDEQLQLLGYDDSDDNYGLDDDEVNFINQLRSNNLSIADYNKHIAKQAVEQYIQQTQSGNEPLMQVDLISDDELFLVDLKSRIPDLTDDEALDELERAKANTNIYTRQIQSLRDEYKQREEAILKEEQEQALAEQQAEAARFEQVIVETIQNNSSFDLGDSALELSVDDKNELASFILDTDVAGVRYLAKALNDPKTLVKMAWYALKGEEAFSQISDYYKQEISKTAKANYQKGYDDAKSGKSAAKAVVKKPVTRKADNRALTINDIDL